MARRSLLALGFLLTTVALALRVTGGFITSVGGVRVSAHSPAPAAIGAAVLFIVWIVAAWRARSHVDDLTELATGISRHASFIVASVAGLLAAVTVFYGTFSAAGSDASGYLSQAVMLSGATLSYREPLAAVAVWPDAGTTLAPLGWLAIGGAVQVPTYPTGLPLLMVPLHAVGGTIAACVIGPVCFALAVGSAGMIAGRLAGEFAALIAAVWLATSPVSLASAMQPMGDMPVTAAWLACWTMILGSKPRPAIAGLAAAIAVLIRPNLAPLAAAPALYLLVEPGRSRKSRTASAAAFSAPVAVAGLVVGYLQYRWYGSPLRSGYGSAAEIFSMANVPANAALYARWLLETHGPWLVAAPFAALLIPRRPMRWLLAFAVLVICAYLVYAVFEVWTYVRFLLPAVAILMILTAALVATGLRKMPAALGAPALAILVLALASVNVASARTLGVFRLADRHARASLAGRYLEPIVSPRGVIVSGEQSGALRYYTGRPVFRWDLATTEAFAGASDQLAHEGYDLWIALDDWEEELFRRKFAGTAAASLDWPPVLEAGTEIRTRAWRFRDRQRFLSGATVVTDRLR